MKLGQERIRDWRGKAIVGRTVAGTEKGGGRREQGGKRVPKTKRHPLVEDASEYWDFYKRGVPIRFGTYNVHNVQNRGLESVLRGMYQASMDLGIFCETKVTEGIYNRGLAGYSVVTMDAPR